MSWQDQEADTDFGIRSFDIYSQYAKQFEVPDDVCKWIKIVLLNSCIPEAYLSEEIREAMAGNLKLSYALNILELVRIRFFRLKGYIEQQRINEVHAEIKVVSMKLLSQYNQHLQPLMSLVEKSIKLTGSMERQPDCLSPIDVCRLLEMS